jgi:hypothetical protein
MNPSVLAWAAAQPAGSQAAVLAAAYLSGTSRVTVDGRTVEYRSVSEMGAVLNALYGASNADMRRPSYSVARVSDGFA